MAPVCTERQHQLFYSKKSLLDFNLPPRKLLQRRNEGLTVHLPDRCLSSPCVHDKLIQECYEESRAGKDGGKGEESGGEEAAAEEETEVDAYSCDEFRMYEFKVRRCMRGRTHDWTDCPFAHPGEKARRRDPRRYHYSGNVCPDFRRAGNCPRGEACDFAHGVFECWLHPSRYRTIPCKDGRRCRRKVCFFAHSPAQLRVVPNAASVPAPSPPPSPNRPGGPRILSPFRSAAADAAVSSPSSTLFVPISPAGDQLPLAPGCVRQNRNCFPRNEKGGRSLLPRGKTGGKTGWEWMLEEVMTSLKEMDIWSPPVSGVRGRRSSSGFSAQRIYPSPGASTSMFRMAMKDPGVEQSSSSSCCTSNSGGCGPDLEWVNELLM